MLNFLEKLPINLHIKKGGLMSNKGKKFVDLDQLAKFFSEKLDETINPLTKKIDHIYNSLISKAIIKPLVQSSSPKQITDRGRKLLNDYNVDSYLNSNCILLKDENLKGKTDAQIFIECLNWVKTKGKEKIVEIILNSNVDENQCNELLSLAILEKIKKSTPDK